MKINNKSIYESFKYVDKYTDDGFVITDCSLLEQQVIKQFLELFKNYTPIELEDFLNIATNDIDMVKRVIKLHKEIKESKPKTPLTQITLDFINSNN